MPNLKLKRKKFVRVAEVSNEPDIVSIRENKTTEIKLPEVSEKKLGNPILKTIELLHEYLDVEVFSFTALEEAWKNARLPSEREHVTPYIKKSDNQYLCLNIENTNDLSNYQCAQGTYTKLPQNRQAGNST